MRVFANNRTGCVAALMVAASLGIILRGTAHAQGATQPGPNAGALTFSGGLDVPTVYFFRGIRQESDAHLTLWPYGDVRILLRSGEGGSRSLTANFGVWNSLNTGKSGSGGPLKKIHYQENFYTGLRVGLGAGIGLTTTLTARTSPNGGFQTIRELDVAASKGGRIAPYGLVAFELSSAGQADGGSKKGRYLEFGAGPNIGMFGKTRLTVPLKVGFSLKDYYELLGRDIKYHDSRFGFFEVGGLVTVPFMTGSQFGSWHLHGGASVLLLGDTTQAFNQGRSHQVVGLAGAGVAY